MSESNTLRQADLLLKQTQMYLLGTKRKQVQDQLDAERQDQLIYKQRIDDLIALLAVDIGEKIIDLFFKCYLEKNDCNWNIIATDHVKTLNDNNIPITYFSDIAFTVFDSQQERRYTIDKRVLDEALNLIEIVFSRMYPNRSRISAMQAFFVTYLNQITKVVSKYLYFKGMDHFYVKSDGYQILNIRIEIKEDD